ncbi:transcriptional regulator, partial [Xanthomonas oryzae]|uniref:transcriptional regulator n=1 Tax=Xanthomonas oryzae TaxID=347 RepID=UPI00095F1B43
PAYDAWRPDPARPATPHQVPHTRAEVLTKAEAAGVYPLPGEERKWVDAPAVGRELTPFDPSEELTTAEAISAFLAEAEATADPAYIEHAREVAARARAMHGIE